MERPAEQRLDDLSAFCLWNSGHLLENRTRGAYAEWLVHRALGIPTGMHRIEWAPVDLQGDDFTLEIKSAAYVQSWQQQQPSRISFATEQRTATAYVFCLLEETNPERVDPQDLGQCRFWVVPTRAIHPERRSIGLQALTRSFGEGLRFEELKRAVDNLRPTSPSGDSASTSIG